MALITINDLCLLASLLKSTVFSILFHITATEQKRTHAISCITTDFCVLHIRYIT